jgi:hypothetical protein
MEPVGSSETSVSTTFYRVKTLETEELISAVAKAYDLV